MANNIRSVMQYISHARRKFVVIGFLDLGVAGSIAHVIGHRELQTSITLLKIHKHDLSICLTI